MEGKRGKSWKSPIFEGNLQVFISHLSEMKIISMFYNFFIPALFTACFYHFLFWRYLNSCMTRISWDILLPFLNSNDLNSCVTAIAQRTEIIKLNHLYLYDIQTASHLNCFLEVHSDFYFFFWPQMNIQIWKPKEGETSCTLCF